MKFRKKIILCTLLCIFCTFCACSSSDSKPVSQEETFLMVIEDIFTITGRGTVVTGRVDKGVVRVGDVVEIVGLTNEKRETTVDDIEAFRAVIEQAEAGDQVGILLKDVARDDVHQGQVLATPGSIDAHTRFTADISILKAEEGSLSSSIRNGENLQFYFHTIDIEGHVSFLEEAEELTAGESAQVEVVLTNLIAMEEGLEFSIRKEGKTLATGTVREILAE